MIGLPLVLVILPSSNSVFSFFCRILHQLLLWMRKLASEAFRKAIGISSTEDRLEAAKALLHGHCIDLPSDNALLLLVDESKRRLGNNVAHQRYSRAWYLEIVTKEQGNAELIDILFPNP
ncbi:hypothetical protein F5051DRAFT_415852, partial [Lentinula edodes]